MNQVRNSTDRYFSAAEPHGRDAGGRLKPLHRDSPVAESFGLEVQSEGPPELPRRSLPLRNLSRAE